MVRPRHLVRRSPDRLRQYRQCCSLAGTQSTRTYFRWLISARRLRRSRRPAEAALAAPVASAVLGTLRGLRRHERSTKSSDQGQQGAAARGKRGARAALTPRPALPRSAPALAVGSVTAPRPWRLQPAHRRGEVRRAWSRGAAPRRGAEALATPTRGRNGPRRRWARRRWPAPPLRAARASASAASPPASTARRGRPRSSAAQDATLRAVIQGSSRTSSGQPPRSGRGSASIRSSRASAGAGRPANSSTTSAQRWPRARSAALPSRSARATRSRAISRAVASSARLAWKCHTPQNSAGSTPAPPIERWSSCARRKARPIPGAA